MTIRTLALDSGVTSIQDHRLALGAFMAPGASVLERRGGLYCYPGAADLVSAAALQATVSPFLAVVDGTSNSLQGQVVVVVDTAVTLTFSAGEPSVARTDRVVLQIRDTTYDASGSTDARVLVLKGNTSTGAATTLPASSLLLWEVVVPIAASSITFTSARTDRRQWIATPMRIPVNSSTERDALPAIPGLEATRLDTGNVEQYWSGAWRIIAPNVSVAAYAKRTQTNGSMSAVSGGTYTTVPLGTAVYAVGMSSSTNTITVSTDGYYHISANFETQLSAPGSNLNLRISSATDIGVGITGDAETSATATRRMSISGDAFLTAGTTIILQFASSSSTVTYSFMNAQLSVHRFA